MGATVKGTVLIVDDEPTALKVLEAILSSEGYRVSQAGGVEEAIEALQHEAVDTIVTDMKMPGKTGLDLFNHVKKDSPDIPVIFLTAYGNIEAAVNLMHGGAYHYFVKPLDYKSFKSVLAQAVEQGRLAREINLLRTRRVDEYNSLMILGDTPEMKRIYNTIQSIRNSSCNVLVCGETGTGKELIARALHYSSNRSHRPFVAVNCAAIPRDLIEAELFGHEKGAFTGASQRRVGKIESASGGTLFLDEIGELDPSVQSKLLRVLQEKEFSRLGDNSSISIDFRLISSTNRDLREEIERDNFRIDLFYRLNVVSINIPPLRDRKEDLRRLTNAFVEEFCLKEDKFLTFSSDVFKAFHAYTWPGNVRELKNVVEGLVVLASGKKVTVGDLPDFMCTRDSSVAPDGSIRTLRELEARAIRDVLQQCRGNKSQAAKLLGVSRKTLYSKIATLQQVISH